MKTNRDHRLSKDKASPSVGDWNAPKGALPRHDGQSPSPSNPEGWVKSVTVQGIQWRLFSIHELTEHPLNKTIYGDNQPDKELLDSIRNVGVLSPIIVNKDRQILSGTRRWKALKILAEEGICPITSLLDGASSVYAICVKQSQGKGLAGEQFLIEANRQREKTPEQKAREFTELKRIETALLKEKEHVRKTTQANLPESPKGQARDIAAEKVGLTSRTAEKLEAVVKAADNGDPIARAGLDQINQTGRGVEPVYRAVVNKPVACACPKCGKHFESRTQLKKHGMDDHGVSPEYIADFLNGLEPAKYQENRFDLAKLFVGSDIHIKPISPEMEGISGRFHITLKNRTADEVRAFAKILDDPDILARIGCGTAKVGIDV